MAGRFFRSWKATSAAAKTKPGKLNYSSGGNGTNLHIAAELFMMMAGVSMVHVPYKGGAPALIDLVGGQIDLMFETVPTAMQYVKNGKLKGLAVTTLQRSGMMPAVPTISEAGLKGYEVILWHGLIAPKGLPKPILDRMHAEGKLCQIDANTGIVHQTAPLGGRLVSHNGHSRRMDLSAWRPKPWWRCGPGSRLVVRASKQ